MTMKVAQGWQVMLADLSLILFLTTAAGLDADAPEKGGDGASTSEMAAQADPVAVFRPGTGISLGEWLASRTGDPREALTVLARYRSGHRGTAMAVADGLAAEASLAGIEARILVEPSGQETTAVLVTFQADPQVARQLQQ